MDEIAEIRLDPETVLTFLEEDSKILQLPTLSDLFPTESDVATTTPAVPYKSQKGFTKLLYQHHTYTKKRTMKSSSTWRCTNRNCKGTIKTYLDSYEVIDSTPHNSCAPLIESEFQLLLSEQDIVHDDSTSSTRELADNLHHPYSFTTPIHIAR